MTGPNPATTFPLEGIKTLCFLKNVVNLKNVSIGEYTYYDDFENVENFAKNMRYHFEFTGDCSMSGDTFILTGTNVLSVDGVQHPVYAGGGRIVNKLVRAH
jgi:virginiamycin A acetyltransferase